MKRKAPVKRIEPYYRKAGRQIHDARLASGFTQERLAKRIGVTRSQIANLETGKSRVLLHVAVKIAGVLKVTLNDIGWLA